MEFFCRDVHHAHTRNRVRFMHAPANPPRLAPSPKSSFRIPLIAVPNNAPIIAPLIMALIMAVPIVSLLAYSKSLSGFITLQFLAQVFASIAKRFFFVFWHNSLVRGFGMVF